MVHDSPQDTSSPKSIIYSSGGTLVELMGNVSFDTLREVAASMERVPGKYDK